jgi:hypothetical protein
MTQPRRPNRILEPQQCNVCGEPFRAKRRGAFYCSGNCKMRAWVEAHKPAKPFDAELHALGVALVQALYEEK